ncbi:hypothetical protein PCIT_b0944 [Pseudoalteromonas citrea]|uniref:Uncharacterized protein n=1 Tax=Pseudoalteromonas citrea TaxID=43655 RepID=A0AAD4AF69_9GAMM|nr:hypothetical protein PCIT_b0944 [Pseudoalteromonas citrea]
MLTVPILSGLFRTNMSPQNKRLYLFLFYIILTELNGTLT